MLLLGDQVLLSEVFVEPVAELANTINVIIVGDLLVYGVADIAEDFRNPKFSSNHNNYLQSICVTLSLNGAHSGGEHNYIGKVVTVDEVDELISEFPHLSREDARAEYQKCHFVGGARG